jgi:cell division septation protein DedD
LVAFVAQNEQLSYKQAEKKINSFVKGCEKNLQLNGSLLFDGIGKISIDENKAFQFSPTSNFIQSNSFGFSEVNLTPINRIKGALIESLDNNSKQTSESELDKLRARRKFTIWPFRVTATIAAFFLLSTLIVNLTKKDTNAQNQTATIFSIPTPKKQVVPTIVPNEVINTPLVQKAEQLTSNELAKETAQQPIIEAKQAPKLAPIKDIVKKKENFETQEMLTKTPASISKDATISMKSQSPIVVENVVSPSIKEESNTVTETRDKKGKSVVVVGSFTSKNRAETYQTQLNSTGYNSYIMGIGVNYRVCIVVNNDNLDAQFAKIKSDINSKAWLLE